MAWQVKESNLEYQTGRHYVILHNPATGAEHHLIIHLSHDSCPTCGHVKPKDATDTMDFKAILKQELENLETAHAQTAAYAKKFGIPAAKVTS